ncbi:hypothetical protein HYW55_03885 [Candidatus Gottesmanbacteria bacterium]|nr:hypothetical protein [Candidatus Gottesmanbacteria bacterium]
MCFLHVHDDNHLAIPIVEQIHELSDTYGFAINTELVHPRYTGERNGTRPKLDEARRFGINVPDRAYLLLSGSSFRYGDPESLPQRIQLAMRQDASGVHSTDNGSYGNGNNRLPTGGLTGIMGKGHFTSLLDNLWGFTKDHYAYPELVKDLARLGREYALQHGNLEHRWAIAFARMGIEHPDVVRRFAQEIIGAPHTWLDNPIPDLEGVVDYLVFNKLDLN